MKRILILDDEILCDLVARVIDSSDRVFLSAKNVAKARAILESVPVDLVMLDPNIQNGFGISLLEDLRRKSKTFVSHPKIIVMSAAGARESTSVDQKNGTYFLSKPFQIAGLRDLVENLLKKSEVE